MALKVSASGGGGGKGELRGTSLGGGVLGFDVVGSFVSFESPGGGGLGKDKIGLKLTYLSLIDLILSLQ